MPLFTMQLDNLGQGNLDTDDCSFDHDCDHYGDHDRGDRLTGSPARLACFIKFDKILRERSSLWNVFNFIILSNYSLDSEESKG